MKKKLSALLVCLLSVVLAFALVACGGGTLTISDTSLSLTVGDTKQLTLKEGENDVTKDAKWESSDAKVVTVDSRGNVVAKAAGSATVTGTYNSASAKCEVTVTAKEVVTVTITDESGTEIKTASVERGATITLKATTSNDSEVTWTSGDTTYATVAPVSGQKNTVTVTGVFPTAAPVKIFAKSGSTQVSVDLTVTAPAGNPTWYDMVARNEDGTPVDGAGSVGQNKSPLGRWTFWRDQAGWNNGNADMGTAEYLGDNDASMAGSIHLSYTNGMPSTNAGCKAPDTVQITFRSPTTKLANKDATPEPNEGGLLENGKYYKLTAEITVDFEGVVTINGTETLLHSGKNNVEIWFQHNDDGAIRTRANGYFNPDVEGDSDYDIYQFPAFYMTMGSYKENTFVPEADITIAKLQWTEFTPDTLKAPTVAMSGDKATVTDTVNTAANVDGYEIGFFATADAQTPKYTVKAAAGETTINSASWDNGTYIVKVRALPASGKYQASPWSAATDVTYTVEHEALVYDLPFSEEANITADGWYYWNELGKKTEEDAHGIVEAKYNDGTLTYEFNETAGSWYSQQLFYNNTSLAAGSYTVTFKFTSSVEGTIRINGTYYEFTAGETKTITATAAPGIMISIQFGKANDDFSATASAIQAGRFTITDIDIASGGTQPAPEHPKAEDYDLGEAITPTGTELVKGGEQDIGDNTDKWYYWYVEDASWNCGSVVTVTDPAFANGVFSITYNGGSVNYCTQLFYKASNLDASKQYFLTLTIETDKAVTVGLHGETYQLTAGTHTLTAIKAPGATSLSIQFNAVTEATTVKVSNVKWQEIKGSQQKPTGGFEFGEEKNISNGWAYWNDQDWAGATVAVTEHTLTENSDGTFTIAVKYNCTKGGTAYGFQIFYNNTALYTVGKNYTLTFTVTSKTDCTITVNGQSITLTAETPKPVEIAFLYNFNAADAVNTISLFDMQAAVETGKSYELTLANIKWTEQGGTQPETPAEGKEITVTPTEWYGNTFVKLSMSDADFALVKTAANCKVNGGDVQPHGEGKGFLVDGTVLQVQLPEAYAAGKTYTVVWYDAQGNAIAHATFTCQQA